MSADPALAASDVFPAETQRLLLRLIRASDEAFYCSLYMDRDTMRHIGPVLDHGRAVRCFRAARSALRPTARRAPPRLATFVVIEKATNVPVGIGSLDLGKTQHRHAEAGIILHRTARCRGYAREALAELVTRVFAASAVDRIWAQHSADHSMAARLMGSLGFVRSITTAGGAQPAMQVWTLDRTCWNSNENRKGIQ